MKLTTVTMAIMASTAAGAAIPAVAKRSGTISITPHDSYSSSIGVLGCKINTNRVAYWPGSPGCDNMCVKVSANGRSVNLLKIDSSDGAYDVSYDAWNYLLTGQSATTDPQAGGGFNAEYEQLPMSECTDLMNDGKLGLSAANSMDFVASCLSNSWFANNHELWNIDDPTCTLGFNEVCSLDLSVSNQPTCPHTLGLQNALTSDPVTNILYPSGDKQVAS